MVRMQCEKCSAAHSKNTVSHFRVELLYTLVRQVALFRGESHSISDREEIELDQISVQMLVSVNL